MKCVAVHSVLFVGCLIAVPCRAEEAPAAAASRRPVPRAEQSA
jgi:hypothetical protein